MLKGMATTGEEAAVAERRKGGRSEDGVKMSVDESTGEKKS